jgi:predicted RNA-binding protein YlqC (UPF0109 family)
MSDVEDLDELGVEDDGGPPAPTARTVLEYLVAALVDDQGAVTIDVDEGRVVALRVRVAPDDMGRVIGRRGRIANAIRTVVRAAAVRDGVEVDVDFVD